jgi:hypothetical protein
MLRRTLGVLAAAGALLLTAVPASATAVEPLPRAHAHNDYEHERPLLDALDHGFTSCGSGTTPRTCGPAARCSRSTSTRWPSASATAASTRAAASSSSSWWTSRTTAPPPTPSWTRC